MAIEIIKCKEGNVFSMCAEPRDIDWRFQKIWYKAQGCIVETVENSTFGDGKSKHLESIDHEYEAFINELIEDRI